MAARVITVTSGKGGVGKTTATANIGAALAKRGRGVVVIDADIGLRNLDVVMGLENRVVYNLVHVIRGVTTAERALIRDKRVPGLSLLAADRNRHRSSATRPTKATVSATPTMTSATMANLRWTGSRWR